MDSRAASESEIGVQKYALSQTALRRTHFAATEVKKRIEILTAFSEAATAPSIKSRVISDTVTEIVSIINFTEIFLIFYSFQAFNVMFKLEERRNSMQILDELRKKLWQHFRRARDPAPADELVTGD